VDYPAAYHDGAGSFGMADGHAELHKWNRPFGSTMIFPPMPNAASTLDLQWLAMDIRINNQVLAQLMQGS
jgi:prepilin-type processing-associated H-X9-DG protein